MCITLQYIHIFDIWWHRDGRVGYSISQDVVTCILNCMRGRQSISMSMKASCYIVCHYFVQTLGSGMYVLLYVFRNSRPISAKMSANMSANAWPMSDQCLTKGWPVRWLDQYPDQYSKVGTFWPCTKGDKWSVCSGDPVVISPTMEGRTVKEIRIKPISYDEKRTSAPEFVAAAI